MRDIEITMGSNGYPQDLHKGVIDFETFKEIEEYAEEHGGIVCTFRKKDGWALWEVFEMNTHKPMELTSEDYGDDYFLIPYGYYKDFDEFKEDYLFDGFADGYENMDDCLYYIEKVRTIWENYEALEEGQAIIRLGYEIVDVINVESLSFYHDTWTYEIGVMYKKYKRIN